MSDLVKRLRGMETYGYQSQLACEAADCIDALEAALREVGDMASKRLPHASIARFSRTALSP